MVTVKIVYQRSGKAAKGRKVSIGFNSIGREVTSSEYTDGDGEAHFDAKPGDGKYFVTGDKA